jgi:hypothetical protein
MYQKSFATFYFVEILMQHNVYGFRCQCSGVGKKQKTAYRKQMTEDKKQYVFCHLTSVICYLTPDTRNLKPKMKPRFANY